MSLSLTTLIQESRNLLGDLAGVAVFSDAQLTDWINQFIREFSIYLPRITEYEVSCDNGVHAYALETVHTGVISVEYPEGEDPKQYLSRRAYTHPLFYQEDGYYDFFKPSDGETLNPPQIIISNSPSTGETILCKLLTEHTALSDGADTITFQDRHGHLIVLFVRWKAWQELSMNEGMYPGPLNTFAGNPELNAEKAENSFRKALAAALTSETESAVMPWKADKFDGSY
jgi:hypothetical protein